MINRYWFVMMGFLLAIGVPLSLLAQDEDAVTTLIEQGIALHDEGKYNEALKKYEQALKIDKNSLLANYEMGLTFLTIEQYEKSIKYFDKVIKAGGGDRVVFQAYVNKATAFDELGKPKDAMKIYEKALKIYPSDHLLYYNMGITQMRLDDAGGAERSFIQSISLNPSHASSHFTLANLQQFLGYRPQALMAQFFFLLLEPDSKRSTQVYYDLINQFNSGVTKYITEDADGKIKVDVTTAENSDGALGVLDISFSMWQLMGAIKKIDSVTVKTDMEQLVEQTSYFFELLTNSLEDGSEHSGFYWEQYAPFFSNLYKYGHTEAFCYHISFLKGLTVEKWVTEHEDKVNAFFDWLRGEEE